MASPPFDIAAGVPGDTDVVSAYPAVERTYRDVVESIFAREHDIVIGSGSGSAHHKFGVGNDAARDAITDWVVGSIWFNTVTMPVTLQRVVSIGPVVWENVSSSAAALANDVNLIIGLRRFNRSF